MSRCRLAMSVIALSLAMLLFGCGLTAATGEASQAAEAFHQQFNAGQFSTIYSSASPQFQSATTEGDFTKLLDAVQRKLGDFKSAQDAGWRSYSGTSGTRVTLSQRSQFEHGSGTETFVFSISDAHATLLGYNINSQELILK